MTRTTWLPREARLTLVVSGFDVPARVSYTDARKAVRRTLRERDGIEPKLARPAAVAIVRTAVNGE